MSNQTQTHLIKKNSPKSIMRGINAADLLEGKLQALHVGLGPGVGFWRAVGHAVFRKAEATKLSGQFVF